MAGGSDDIVRQLERELYANQQHKANVLLYAKSVHVILDLLAQIENRAGAELGAKGTFREQFKEKKIFALAKKTIAEHRHAQNELSNIEPKIKSAERFLDQFRFYRNYAFSNTKSMEKFGIEAARAIGESQVVFAPAFLGKIDLNQMASDMHGKVVPAKGVEFPVEKLDGIFDYLDARKNGSQARFLFQKLKIVRTSAGKLYCETDNEILRALDRLAEENNGRLDED